MGFASMPRIRQLCHLRLASMTSNVKWLSRASGTSCMISLLVGAGRLVLQGLQQCKEMQQQVKGQQESPSSQWPRSAVTPSQNKMGQIASDPAKLALISPPAKLSFTVHKRRPKKYPAIRVKSPLWTMPMRKFTLFPSVSGV